MEVFRFFVSVDGAGGACYRACKSQCLQGRGCVSHQIICWQRSTSSTAVFGPVVSTVVALPGRRLARLQRGLPSRLYAGRAWSAMFCEPCPLHATQVLGDWDCVWVPGTRG